MNKIRTAVNAIFDCRILINDSQRSILSRFFPRRNLILLYGITF